MRQALFCERIVFEDQSVEFSQSMVANFSIERLPYSFSDMCLRVAVGLANVD